MQYNPGWGTKQTKELMHTINKKMGALMGRFTKICIFSFTSDGIQSWESFWFHLKYLSLTFLPPSEYHGGEQDFISVIYTAVHNSQISIQKQRVPIFQMIARRYC